jgi:hypothetical protein
MKLMASSWLMCSTIRSAWNEIDWRTPVATIMDAVDSDGDVAFKHEITASVVSSVKVNPENKRQTESD